ncbi:short-chain dehydrogenase [Crepidotus variabilis]|uniref:Short-chain dehydrogenase n=1 Tax=Crepidotus variabilis TaxID=179855 RepID=A0A9P6JMW7_9AGAR|nr:short-chain dehydrogenase [Crepidotus variabilis]
MQISFLQFIRNQLATVPPVTTQDLTGKTVVVVGANAGIGYEATKHFAKMNPGRLVLACRSKARGEEALEKIKQETGYTTAELRLVDLTSFESVNTFAAAFNKEVDRLDILLLNAAILPQVEIPTTKDGWEMSFQTNHISPSLVAILLLPKLSETASKHQTVPRLVLVSSEVHYWAKFEQEMIDSPNPHRVFGSMDYFNPARVRYNDTKLFNVFFTRALAARSVTQSPSVVINTVNPGFCYSSLRQFKSYASRLLNYFMEITLARTTEEGARQLIWAALGSKEGDERALNGAYISGMEILEPADSVVSEEGKALQNKLWDDLINELEQVNPNVREITTKYLK